MKFEHFALNVEDPQNMSLWYEANLGLKPVKKMTEPPYMTFLADDSGSILIEIYANPKGETLKFQELHPVAVHLAFVSENPTEDKNRLISAGASLVSDDIMADGSHLIMLKDPWGFAIQLCKRAIPMLRNLG